MTLLKEKLLSKQENKSFTDKEKKNTENRGLRTAGLSQLHSGVVRAGTLDKGRWVKHGTKAVPDSECELTLGGKGSGAGHSPGCWRAAGRKVCCRVGPQCMQIPAV